MAMTGYRPGRQKVKLLQFVLSNPLVNVALVGMRTPEIVERNVQICNDASGRINLSALHEKYV